MKKIVLPAIILLTAALLTAGCKNPPSHSKASDILSNTVSSEISESTDTESTDAQSTSVPMPESSVESSQVTSGNVSSESESSAGGDESSEPSGNESHEPSEHESQEPSLHESSTEESSQVSEVSQKPVIYDPREDITTVYGIENKYFVNKLNDQEKKSFAILYHTAAEFEPYAKFTLPVEENDFDRLMWLLNYDCPELIHLKGDYAPQYDNSGKVSGVRFYFNMTAEEYPACRKELDDLFSALMEQTAGMSEYETEKYVYDIMFNDTVYTETTERSGSAYGSLIEHRARCEGISKGFAWCMNELGIKCMTLSGYPLWENSGMYSTHSWNIIRLGNDFYHVDLTADNLRDSEDQTVMPLYSFLNQCDEIMSKTHMPLEMYRDMGVPACTKDDMNFHVMNGLVITSDDDQKTRLWELLDRFYSQDDEVSIPIRFRSAGSYEDFLDNWESYYSEYLENNDYIYRYAFLYSNDVGNTVNLYIEE